jgi:VanZ family protein
MMPFDLSANWGDLVERFDRAWQYWPFDDSQLVPKRAFADGVFFIPLGFLLAAHWMAERNASRPSAFLAAATLSVAASSLVEGSQLLEPARHAKVCDLLMQATGGIVGSVLGVFLVRTIWPWVTVAVGSLGPRRLVAWAAVVMGALLLLDAVDPMMPVQSMRELRNNLWASQLGLEGGFAEQPWYYWAVCRVGVYAVFAAVLGAAGPPTWRRRWLVGATLAVTIAVALEALAPFEAGRHVNVANVVSAVCGSALGAILANALSGRLSHRGTIILAAALLLAFIAYKEWRPFTFQWDTAMMAGKVPSGTAWLPLSSLVLRRFWLDDARDLLEMAAWSGALVYIVSLASAWLNSGSRTARLLKAAVLATAVGLAMELPQFMLREREPSTTHVFVFTIGGLVGALAYVFAPAVGSPVDATGADDVSRPDRQVGACVSNHR